MPFPLIKLGYLAVRQVSKPIANAIKLKAKTSPILRNYILLPPAQIYHKFDTIIKMRLLGLGKVSDVKPLNEDMAVDLAADMLGEAVIFAIASVTLMFEYRRQMRKDQVKEEVQNRRLQDLENNIQELGLAVEQQSAMIRELTRSMLNSGIKMVPAATGSVSQLPASIVDKSTKTRLKVASDNDTSGSPEPATISDKYTN